MCNTFFIRVGDFDGNNKILINKNKNTFRYKLEH